MIRQSQAELVVDKANAYLGVISYVCSVWEFIITVGHRQVGMVHVCSYPDGIILGAKGKITHALSLCG